MLDDGIGAGDGLCVGSMRGRPGGVQVIGGNNSESIPVSLDDIQLEVPVEIPGYAEITPTFYKVQDCILVRKPGASDIIYSSNNKGWQLVGESRDNINFDLEITCEPHANKDYPWCSSVWVTHIESKTQADYALLGMDITNITSKSVDYASEISVKMVFNEEVEYQGWIRQRNMDLNICTWIDSVRPSQILCKLARQCRIKILQWRF